MDKMKTHENFPAWIVLLANAVSILLYVIGLFICFRLNWIAGTLYLIYILILEFRLTGKHCVNCYYYGNLSWNSSTSN